MPKPRAKAGTSKAAAAARRKAFAQAYIANGRNGTQAAITAGFSPKGADVTAVHLLGEPKVKEMLAELAAPAAKMAGLSVERSLLELSRMAYSDPRRMFDDEGCLIPVHKMDDDVAATLTPIEFDAKGNPTKLKVWDKTRALEMAMRHQGLFERDNAQRRDNLALQVVMVGPE